MVTSAMKYVSLYVTNIQFTAQHLNSYKHRNQQPLDAAKGSLLGFGADRGLRVEARELVGYIGCGSERADFAFVGGA
jgi:hypothetical protein